MKVIIIGGGGREHALAWQMANSERCEELYCAPGNAGMEECAKLVNISDTDIDGLTEFALQKKIDLVVIGPEAPLVAGLADKLRANDIAVFGPSAAAARLEGSKSFMKDLCAKYGVPTARYGSFAEVEAARAFIRELGAPVVVKADGLAAGKGVIIAQTIEEAETAADNMLSGNAFGDAGAKVVIEEFLDGEEASVFAIADGKTVVPFGSAQDHKRAYDGDEGPNTGGMGAYAPAYMMDNDLQKKIEDTIIKPVIAGMAEEGCPFTGVLFAGIMLVNGVPYVLEFNARFGDPECEALMRLFDGDFLDIMHAAAKGALANVKNEIFWRRGSVFCVVMAAAGYPGSYDKNSLIDLGVADQDPEIKIFHAGTARDKQGRLINAGGRVLAVTALGETASQARERVYEALQKIDWPEGFYRKDIGWRALQAEKGVHKASISC